MRLLFLSVAAVNAADTATDYLFVNQDQHKISFAHRDVSSFKVVYAQKSNLKNDKQSPPCNLMRSEVLVNVPKFLIGQDSQVNDI